MGAEHDPATADEPPTGGSQARSTDHDQTETTDSAPPPPDPSRHPSHGERPGDQVGPYKLKEIIGEGGFGTVWLAEQKEPIARRVALKIIKPGMDSKEVIARFEQERHALALMDHPNIARVHDAGTTPAGRPYFAMEFVKGAPITDYCDRQRLTIEQRLELFSSVCDGVQHAHMKGIIHRDLKPSNILVAAPDAASARQGGDHSSLPTVKIIDFGVAKALASKLTEKTIFTERGQLIGTPEYMSPEQAEMAETDIDTRSDVYALGVILYELLAGALPFDPRTLRAAGYAAIQKMIREVDPPRPSTRLSSLGADGSKKIAAARRVGIAELTSSLRGELEWIPLKAMRKDRAERYRTASELGDDIANYLGHKPLIAGPESTTYKVKKFIRRNRAGVAAGTMVFAALILGLAGTGWQYRAAAIERDAARESERQQALLREKSEQLAASEIALRAASEASEKRAKEEAAEAQRQRDAAEQSRKESELIAEFMSNMLEGAGPSVARGRDIAMLREMMDAAAARIEKGDLASAPEAELRLRGTIGYTYKELAVYDAAQSMLNPTVALARATHAGDHSATSDALNRLAMLLQDRGDLAGAEPLFREALDMWKRLFSGDSPAVAGVLNNLASLLKDNGDLAGAEPLFREALDMWKRFFPGDSPEVAAGLFNLASLLMYRGDLAGAEPLCREALDMWKRLFPGDHPSVAAGLNNLAGLLIARSDLAGAEPLYREAFEMTKRLFPGDHPNVAAGLNNLAGLLQDRGDFAEAERLRRQTVDMFKRLFPSDHPGVATGLYNLAALLFARGDLAGAEPLFRESLEMRKRLFPGDHPDVARGLDNLAFLLQARGDLAGAEPLCREALEMRKRFFPGDHPDVAVSLTNAARLLHARGDTAGAELLYREALEMARRLFPGDHPVVARSLNNLAFLLQAGGDLAGAEPLYREALEIMRKRMLGDHPNVAQCLNNLAALLYARGDLEGAEPPFRESLEIRKRVLGEEHPTTLVSYHNLADVLIKVGRHAEAAPLVEKCIDGNTKTVGAAHGSTRYALAQAVKLYESWDKAEPGKGYDVKAVEWKAKLDAITPPAEPAASEKK